MSWTLATDGSQYPWVTAQYGWGLGYLSQDGKRHDWLYTKQIGKTLFYKAGDIEIRVTRQSSNDGDLRETYMFTNTGKQKDKL